MAFSGLHVISAYAGAGYMRDRSQTVRGKIQWSESPATGVTTTNVAPGFDGQRGQPIFRIRAAAFGATIATTAKWIAIKLGVVSG